MKLQGKQAGISLKEMEEAGVSIVIYSTPCLFAAQHGIERYLESLVQQQGKLPDHGTVDMDACTTVLNEGMKAAWYKA